MFYLRLLLVTVWFMFSAVVALAMCLFRWRDTSNGYFFARMLNSAVPLLTGIRVVVDNEQRLYDSKPCIYIGNHQDNADLIIESQAYTPKTVVIGKKELLWIPFFGVLFYAAGNILIVRQKHDKAMAGMAQAKRCLLEEKASIFMFPEGTRNRGAEKLLPFKKGAFYMAVEAQVPLVPVVAGPNGAFVDFKNKKIHAGTAHIEVLEPISTKGLTEADVPRLIETAYARMQDAYERLKLRARES